MFVLLIVQLSNEKQQSSLSRKGASCVLLPVKFVTLRGISARVDGLMASLNCIMQSMSPFPIFMLSGYQT